MTTIGIDFSINSPGMCIHQDDKYKYFGFIRKDYNLNKFEKSLIDKFSISINNIKTIWLNSHIKSEIYYEREILNLKDAIYLIDIIIKNIQDNVDDSNSNIYVALEGLSFGSKANRLAEISGYQFLLRNKIYDLGYNLYIFSPKTIKLTAGKGSLTKEGIQQSFIKENINKEQLKIFQTLSKKKVYPHPFEDMIDAYWTLKTLENKILNIF